MKCEQGNIFWVDFNPSVGHEFQNRRPAIVVESSSQIAKSNLITVMPLTSNLKNKLEDDVIIKADKKNRLMCDSVIKVYDIMSFDYLRFLKLIGTADESVIKEVKKYLIKHFNLK